MGQPRPGYWCVLDISSIHLLRTFIDAGNIGPCTETWQTVIHLTVILSAIGIAFVDRLGQFALARRHNPEQAE